MDGSVALKQAKNYVDEVLKGAGALKGVQGDPGKDGKDAPTITNVSMDENNVLSTTLSDGTVLPSGTIQTVAGKDGVDGVNGKDGTNGTDGVDGVTPHIDPVTKHWFTGTTDTGIVAEGKDGQDGQQGIQGQQGNPGVQGIQGIQGVKGDKGDDGCPFLIYKEYADVSEFSADDFPQIGLLFMIKVEDATSFPVYRYTGEADNPYSFITNLSGSESIKGDKGDPGKDGEQGVQGQAGTDGTTYTPTIGTVTSLPSNQNPTASVIVNEDAKTAAFSFGIPKGDRGSTGKSAYEIAVENGFKGTEEKWLESINGKDGRSITAITTDLQNNVIVTFSDGTEQNIGQLNIDVQADFLTSSGFGNLRYMNGKFQYLDKDTNTWIDTSVSPENVYEFNMTPQPIEFIYGIYDHASGHYKLKWKEPKDTVIDGQVACVVEKVLIVRKLGCEPENPNDGEIVTEIKRSHFGVHENAWFVDESFSPEMGDVWHYKAFPYATTGFYGNLPMNDTGGITAKDYVLYGFKIDQNESDPDSMISYIEDNQHFQSAYMNYSNNSFDYGGWKNAFFMNVKPCMLKYDGTVDYFLNPNDYTLKEDGTPSDVTDTAYDGNAMVQFPKVYWKIVDNGDDTANVYISDKKVDDDFVCWSHIDNNGEEIDYCYMPIYNGSNVNNVLRSLSGRPPMTSQTVQTEINYAKANNQNNDVIWYTEVYCDRTLVNLLLFLIGKSTDTQKVFGTGISGSSSVKNSGTMGNKGVFWGNQDNVSGVKIFGIENWWGNVWHRIGGYINDRGAQKVKMTYGKSDSSTVDGYNLDGTGYIKVTGSTPLGTSGGYISKMLFTKNGFIPVAASGSATTYYVDGLYFNNGQINYPLCNGTYSDGKKNGALFVYMAATTSWAGANGNASISCKPLATGGVS